MVKFTEKGAENPTSRSFTVKLAKEYDQFVKNREQTPAAAATGVQEVFAVAEKMVGMRGGQSNSQDAFKTILEMQQNATTQTNTILAALINNNGNKGSDIAEMTKAACEMAKMGDKGDTTKMLMEMQQSNMKMFAEMNKKDDSSIFIAMMKSQSESNNMMMQMMMQQQQMMMTQMQASNQQTIALFTQVNNAPQKDSLEKSLLGPVLQSLIGNLNKNSLEDLVKTKQTLDMLMGPQDIDEEEEEEEERPQSITEMAMGIVKDLIPVLPQILSPMSNALAVNTIMKQLPNEEHLRHNPQIQQQVAEEIRHSTVEIDQMRRSLSEEELQIIQYRTGVDFGLPVLSHADYNAIVQNSIQTIQNADYTVEESSATEEDIPEAETGDPPPPGSERPVRRTARVRPSRGKAVEQEPAAEEQPE
jgi:hypothetical protein